MEATKSTAPPSVRTYYVAVGTHAHKLTTLLELLTALQLQAGQKLSTVVICSSRDVLDTTICALQDNPLFSVCGLHSDLTDKEREFQISRFQRQLAIQNEALTSADGADDARKGPQSGSDTAAQGGQRTAGLPGDVARGAPAQGSAQASRPGAGRAAVPGGAAGGGNPADPQPSLVLVTTDVCLRAIPRELQPLGVSLLIQYDLPTKKEQLTRRISTVFGGGRERRSNRPTCVIDFVVGGGEVELFRAVERFTQTPILEMPVHVGELFV